MSRYAIGLGSNVGDRRQHLATAVDALTRRLGEPKVSSIYETEPVGGPEQDPYLNAAVVVETDVDALEVLDICQEIEQSQGRERKVRWGPRTLDLDIITSDRPGHHDERLTIPHPRAAEREFVLRPLDDVWPEAPVADGITAREALDRVGDQGVERLADDWIPPVSHWKANALLAGQFALFILVAVALAYDGTLPGDDVNPFRVGGGAVAFVGAVMAFVASRRLGGSLSASPLPTSEGELVIAGPYRFARHPIYGGVSLFLMGTALFLDSILGFLTSAALVPYFMFKARYEERQLRLRYAGYLLYKQTVHRWLIPFLI